MRKSDAMMTEQEADAYITGLVRSDTKLDGIEGQILDQLRAADRAAQMTNERIKELEQAIAEARSQVILHRGEVRACVRLLVDAENNRRAAAHAEPEAAQEQSQ